jgi:hypothetical protein
MIMPLALSSPVLTTVLRGANVLVEIRNAS